MRLAFLGSAPWSVPSLEALAASSHEVALVLTREPRPAGRGSRLRPTAVAEAARRLGLLLREVPTAKAGPGFEALAGARPDALAVVAYGEILPREVLDLPPAGPVNVHFSLLPALRGAAPVQRAILAGMETTGVTTMLMDAGMDTGPVLLQREERVRPDDDAGSLGDRLARVGGDILVRTLDGLASGVLEPRPQDEARATYAPKITAGDRPIDWTKPADGILRLVRALAPEPGAETRFRGRLLKVYRASPAGRDEIRGAEDPAGWIPGRAVLGPGGAMLVGAAGGAVRLEQVAPEGRPRMSGEEFVRGYRPSGEVLG